MKIVLSDVRIHDLKVLPDTDYYLVAEVANQRVMKCPLNPSSAVNTNDCIGFVTYGVYESTGDVVNAYINRNRYC
jgi:hypothetical protein